MPLFPPSLAFLKKGFIAALPWVSQPLYAWETQFAIGAYQLNGQNQLQGVSEQTRLLAFPITFAFEQDRHHFDITSSYLSLEHHQADASKGLGDTFLGYSHDWLRPSGQFTTRIQYKLATGDANQGLSSGQDDLSLQVDYLHLFDPQQSINLTLGYQITGKNAQYEMRNIGFAGFGITHQLQRLQWTTRLDYQQSVYSAFDDNITFSLTPSYSFTSRSSISLTLAYDNLNTTTIGFFYSHSW